MLPATLKNGTMPPKSRTKPLQPDRVGKKGVLVWLSEADKRALKIAAAELDTTMQELTSRAVREYLDKHAKRKS